MATKEQLIKAIHTFIENDMLPKASGNYKIILNTAKVAMQRKPDAVFDLIKKNSLISMLDVIDDKNNVDVDTLATILSEGFGSEEFGFDFRFFGREYTMHFSAADIQTIKRYL